MMSVLTVMFEVISTNQKCSHQISRSRIHFYIT